MFWMRERSLRSQVKNKKIRADCAPSRRMISRFQSRCESEIAGHHTWIWRTGWRWAHLISTNFSQIYCSGFGSPRCGPSLPYLSKNPRGHSQFNRWIFHIRPCYSSVFLAAFHFEELNAVFHLTWEGLYIYIHTGKYRLLAEGGSADLIYKMFCCLWPRIWEALPSVSYWVLPEQALVLHSSLPRRLRESEDRCFNWRLLLRQSWCPLWGRTAFIVVHGACSSSVPSGDRTANPATYGVPGCSDLQRAHISVSSTRKPSRAWLWSLLIILCMIVYVTNNKEPWTLESWGNCVYGREPPLRTRKLYALRWKLFTSWCGDRQLNPGNCPVGTVWSPFRVDSPQDWPNPPWRCTWQW